MFQMTESRRQEMRTYKRQAVLREVARQEKLNFGAATEDTGTVSSINVYCQVIVLNPKFSGPFMFGKCLIVTELKS